MTKAEREAVRARCAAAVAGPWLYLRDGNDRIIAQPPEKEDGPLAKFGHVVFREDSRPYWANRSHDEANWEYAAAARADVPVLIADCEALIEALMPFADARIAGTEYLVACQHALNLLRSLGEIK